MTLKHWVQMTFCFGNQVLCILQEVSRNIDTYEWGRHSQRSACKNLVLVVDCLNAGKTSWPSVFSSFRCVLRWRRIAYCDSEMGNGMLVLCICIWKMACDISKCIVTFRRIISSGSHIVVANGAISLKKKPVSRYLLSLAD